MGVLFYSVLGGGIGVFVICVIIAFLLGRPRRRRNSNAGTTEEERRGLIATEPVSGHAHRGSGANMAIPFRSKARHQLKRQE